MSVSVTLDQIQAMCATTACKVLSYLTIAERLQLPKTEETAQEIYNCVKDAYVVVGYHVVTDPQWWAIFITEVLYHSVPRLEANCAHCNVYQQLGMSHCGTRTLDPAVARAMVYDNLLESESTLYQKGLVGESTLRAIFKSYHKLGDGFEEYEDACLDLLSNLAVSVAVGNPAIFVPALIAQTIGEPEVPSDAIVKLRVTGISGLPLFVTMMRATNYVCGYGEYIITTPKLFYSRHMCGGLHITVVKADDQPLEIMISHPRPGYTWNTTTALMPVEYACTALKATVEIITWTQGPMPTWNQLVRKLYRH